METERQLFNFLNENFIFDHQTITLTRSDSLIGQGIIDSTGVLELINFLENQFEIQIQDEEILPENLDSVERIRNFIVKKKSQPPA
ncbi:acyl carrier protein [candidate division KSB1 bacterium]|nr:acyl carrier protein [candidate division KSB1 bacterium]